MKKAFFYILLSLLSLVGYAQQNEVLFAEANEAYNKGDYQKAADTYLKIEKSGAVSANLYFNLANSYYKLQQVAPSVFYYEKALELQPNDREINNNYRFAQNMRIDQIDAVPKGFLMKAYDYLVTAFKIDTWAWAAVLFIFLFVIAFILFYKTADPQRRKLWFGLWSGALLLAIFCTIWAFQTLSFQNNTRAAIIFAEEVSIQSEPNLRSEALFKLHEGTKVQVLDEVDAWKEIQLSDGKTGWIPKEELKEI